MDTNSGKKMPQIDKGKEVWNVSSKNNLTNSQKEVLKDFFVVGPSTRAELNKKLGKKKRGKSYTQNINKLVNGKLLMVDELIKSSTNLKHTDTSMIKDLKLRKAVKEAFMKNDFGRPRAFTSKKWEEALMEYQMVNYNERFKDEIGESVYGLTVWGIVTHLRSEGKITPRTLLLYGEKSDFEKYDSSPKISNDDLNLVLKHFKKYFPLIFRKWDYLCKLNDPGLVYEKLFHVILLANYYYEVLNADFEQFEKSALEDIELNFFIPYLLVPEYSEKWIVSIVKDNEIYDMLVSWLKDLQENYKRNQEISTEYRQTLESYRKGKRRTKSKFFKKEDFLVKVPTKRRGHIGGKYYLGKGQWGYNLSNFLNVLDFGPLNYLAPLEVIHPWYRKKRGTNPIYIGRIRGLLKKENVDK